MSGDEKARIARVNERNRKIVERLKKASEKFGGDPDYPGAKGLVEADFSKPAPRQADAAK